MIEQIRRQILAADSALIIAHVAPDGDCIGSALALARALRGLGKTVHVSCADGVPKELRFLPGSRGVRAKKRTKEQIIIVVDSSDIDRMGVIYEADVFSSVPVLNIDHHVTNIRYGDVNWVDDRASTSEMIYELVLALGAELDEGVATCILTGIVTDTRCFRTSSTQPETLQVAQDLMRRGANLAEVTDAVFDHRPLAVAQLWGAAMSTLTLDDGILIANVTLDMVKQAGGDNTASQGLSNFLGSIDDARVAVVLRELSGNKVDVSMRSSAGVDISQAAANLGGGGHPRAAGCMLLGSLAEAKALVLAELRATLNGGAPASS